MSFEMNGKRLELLREILPRIRNSLEMAERLGIAIQYFPTPGAAELRAAYAGMTAEPPQAIVVFPDPVTGANRQHIIDFAGTLRIPVVSGWAEYADAGALCTYGPDLRNPIGGSPITLTAF